MKVSHRKRNSYCSVPLEALGKHNYFPSLAIDIIPFKKGHNPFDGSKESDLMFNELAKQFSDNYKLIKFHDWTFEEQKLMITTENIIRKWNIVETQFTNWEFKSLLKESTWTKFVDTFDTLF